MLLSTLLLMQVVVVLSGSMEPGFYRGDILFLNMGQQPIRVGEVVVFNIDDRDIPIVHRVIKVHETQPGGEVSVLTKVYTSSWEPVLPGKACISCHCWQHLRPQMHLLLLPVRPAKMLHCHTVARGHMTLAISLSSL